MIRRGTVAAALTLALAALWAGCASSSPGASAGEAASAAGTGGAPGDAVWQRVVEPFPVSDASGRPYEHPLLGGFDIPRPQFVDIDGDGDVDLFVQERTSQLIFFENVGSPTDPTFEWRSDRWRDLEIGEWSRFTDLDDDGDFDLLSEAIYSYIQYFRNEGTPTEPRFELVADSLYDPEGESIFSDRQNIPNVADIDCDASPDLFLGRADGTVTRYELAEMGEDGVPVFAFVTDRFQQIEIVAQIGGGPPAQDRPVPLDDAPLGYELDGAFDGTRPERDAPTRHGANSMGIADVDGDGDDDFLWGDFFEPSVLLIENRGSCGRPDLRVEPQPVPTVEGDSLLTSGYNAPVPVDLDGDGDLDLAVGVLGGAFNPNRTASDNFHYWERTADGRYRHVTSRFLDAVDVGSESVPTTGDIDGDGDLDLLVGNRISPEPGEGGQVFVFENRGTPGAPAFRLTDTLSFGSNYNYHPVPIDWDGDGDLDLFTGTYNDDIVLVRNEGTPTGPRFVPTDSVLLELTRGSNAVPAFGDMDGDGDPDLFVGESSGDLNYYRNVGTAADPDFELVSDEYLGVDVGQRSHPVVVDWDGDGDPDLLLGREDQGLLLYLNDGSGTLEAAGEVLPELPPMAAPIFRDFDADGDLDILSGGLSGGLVYYENTGG